MGNKISFTKAGLITWALISLILSLIYIAQPLIKPYIPLNLFLKVEAVFPFVLILCYSGIIPAFLILDKMRVSNHIVFIMIIITALFFTPISIPMTWFIISSEKMLNSVQVGDFRYNLVLDSEFGDSHRTCLLYQCNADDMDCTRIPSFDGECWLMRKSALIVNPTTKEINVYLEREGIEYGVGPQLVYTYGELPRNYIDRLTVGGYNYYLAWFQDDGANNKVVDRFIFKFMLYRCNIGMLECERLPFKYDTKGLPLGYLELDEQSGEIKILMDEELIYTYSAHPHCYVVGCSTSY
jgi:hypothetical protein